MSNKTTTRTADSHSFLITHHSSLSRWLDNAALFVILLVVAMRPLIAETYESALQPIAEAVGSTDSTTPATTVWFDLAIWLAALSVAISSFISRRRWRWTGVEIGWLVLVLAAAGSTLTASNQRLAANASADWLTTLAIVFVLANICRDRWRIALVLAVIVASGLTSAAKCAMQIKVENADTRAMYAESKTEFWTKQGVPLDDPRVELFERRMATNQAGGFLPHTNTEGALLGLSGFAALALTACLGQKRSLRIIFWLVALILFAVIALTKSKGGFLAGLVGIFLLLILRYLGPVLRLHWRATFVTAWLLIVGATIALVAYGSVRGGLPGSSLAFRWQYWHVTRHIIAEHFWTGVGALNFDRAYLLVKPIEYPEEIKDPHNFVLAILAQWGLLGGVGMMLALIGASFVAIKRWATPEGGAAPTIDHSDTTKGGALRWIAGLAAGFIALRLWLFRDSLSGDPEARAMVIFDLGCYGLIWISAAAGSLWLMKSTEIHSPTRPALASHRRERERGPLLTTSDSELVQLSCLCGSLAFLLHNTIDYAIFYPGALTPFVALSAVTLARWRDADVAARRLDRIIPLTTVIAVGALFLSTVLIPVTQESSLLVAARTALATSSTESQRLYTAAAAADPLDPTPLAGLAAIRAQMPTLDDLNAAIVAVNAAIDRDREDIPLYHLRSHILELRYRQTGSGADLLGAIGAARQAGSLYPNSPDEHVHLADVLSRAAKEMDAQELRAEAAEHYQQALTLDAARPGTDEVRRWSPDWRNRIQKQIDNLVGRTSSQPTSTVH